MNGPSQLLLCNDPLLSLFPFSGWDKKEPIRRLCGIQWLSKQAPPPPPRQAWLQCPGELPICEEEGLGGKLTCCPDSDKRTELKSYFKEPKGARVGAKTVTNDEQNFVDPADIYQLYL